MGRPGEQPAAGPDAGRAASSEVRRPAKTGAFFPQGLRRSIDSSSAIAVGREQASTKRRPGWSKGGLGQKEGRTPDSDPSPAKPTPHADPSPTELPPSRGAAPPPADATDAPMYARPVGDEVVSPAAVPEHPSVQDGPTGTANAGATAEPGVDTHGTRGPEVARGTPQRPTPLQTQLRRARSLAAAAIERRATRKRVPERAPVAPTTKGGSTAGPTEPPRRD